MHMAQRRSRGVQEKGICSSEALQVRVLLKGAAVPHVAAVHVPAGRLERQGSLQECRTAGAGCAWEIMSGSKHAGRHVRPGAVLPVTGRRYLPLLQHMGFLPDWAGSCLGRP